MRITYIKFRFTSPHGATSGLVMETHKFERMTMQEISRLFPYHEVPKMHKFETSPAYPTWEEAFNHTF